MHCELCKESGHVVRIHIISRDYIEWVMLIHSRCMDWENWMFVKNLWCRMCTVKAFSENLTNPDKNMEIEYIFQEFGVMIGITQMEELINEG